MRRARERRCGHYMQILICMNTTSTSGQAVGSHNREHDGAKPLSDGDAAGHSPPDAGLRREEPMKSDAGMDVDDEMDPDGYGFGV